MPRKRKFHCSVHEVGESSRSFRSRRLPAPMNCVPRATMSIYSYFDDGDCDYVCEHCGALFWFAERIVYGPLHARPRYTHCCKGGVVRLPFPLYPPAAMRSFFEDAAFMENIRAYNNMFSMTSFGARIDEAVNDGRGPYVFKVSGQVSHWIGSICPPPNEGPRFLQLYIYDTDNEVPNMLRFFGNSGHTPLSPDIVRVLGDTLKSCNEYVRLFRSASDLCDASAECNFSVILYNNVGDRRYEPPASGTLGGIVFGDDFNASNYDIIVHRKDGPPPQSRGDSNAHDIGKRVLLPSSFTRGPRYMYKHYQDALAICRVYGNPQYFITFTCNVKWPKISRHLVKIGGGSSQNRPDIIARVFRIKVQQFLRFMKSEKTFGDIVADLYTIEFQKRGLPHCHTLIWVTPSYKVRDATDIDKYISAEIPDPSTEPELYKIVTDLMIHGPCGLARPTSPCMRDSRCSKSFPKMLEISSRFDKDGYVHYRRRDSMHRAMKNGIALDNRYVVPYNEALCRRFNAHINVEHCGWNMMIKYLFKYISKGADRVRFCISRSEYGPPGDADATTPAVNEVLNFVDGRYICPHEAAWRILDFPIHERNPAVEVLAVHLEDMQNVTFRENLRLQAIIRNPSFGKTTLTEWLASNKRDARGLDLTYVTYCSKYQWDRKATAWISRVHLHKAAIGRLAYVHPASGEVFYLRILLSHQRGCKSFADIRTVSSVVHDTYRSACESLGLLGDDREWLTAFIESSSWATSYELRVLFVHLLLFCEVNFGIPLPSPSALASISNRLLMEETCYDSFSENMRLRCPNDGTDNHEDAAEFAAWLLQIGDGLLGEPDTNNPHTIRRIQIPQQYLIDVTDNRSCFAIHKVYVSLFICVTCGTTTQMASQRVHDIRERQKSGTIEVRVIKKWISKGKKEELCYQFVDAYGDCIEATADVKEIEHFDSIIQLQSCYKVTGYICIAQRTYMATVNHPASLVIGHKAKFDRTTNDEIPTMYFNFATYDMIKQRVKNTQLLTDYIGRVEKSSLCPTRTGMMLKKIRLQDQMKREVEITLWPDMSHLIGDNVIPGHIVAITSAMLESTYLTTLMINPDMPQTDEHVQRLKALPAMQPTVMNAPVVTILDLKKSSQQTIQASRNFTCEARIAHIHDNRSWYYVLCSKCSKKLYAEEDNGDVIFVCKDDDDIVPNFRYCVNATITDATGSADAVFFNESMQAILNISCEDMVTKHGQTTNPRNVPQLLKSIVNIPKVLHLTQKNDGQIVVNNVTEVRATSDIQSPAKATGTSTFSPTTPITKPATSKRQLQETPGPNKKQKRT
ncbi:hypothetical protein CASFOL_019753 [Castilleja foliolosa]|uniref:ATP-dependent DNA helicase n=1 Tax=Castilleja foliolosa TaxID=1961234 RepID=A0ABD3D0Y3_9LAMI